MARAAGEIEQRVSTSRMWQRALIVAGGVAVGIGVAARPAGMEVGWIVGLVGLVLFAGGIITGRKTVIRQDWLAPAALFGVVFGAYFVVRPAALLAGLEPVSVGRQGIWAAIVLGFVVVAGFWTGYLLPLGEAIARELPWASRSWPKQRARIAVWLSWGLGLASWVVMIQQSGGVVARISGYGQGIGKGLGVVVVASAVLLGMAVAAGWLSYFKGQLSRVEIAVITASSAGMLAVHGQRAALLVPMLMVVAVYHYLVRRLRGREILLLALAGVLIVGFLGMPRLQFMGGEQVALSVGDYAKLAGWLYAEKPQRNLFNRVLRADRSGSMALSLPAEGYLNFGLAGLLAEALVLGIAYRAAYSYRQRHPRSEPAILGYALAVPIFGLVWRGGLAGGGLGHLIGYGAVAIGIVLFCSGPRWLVARGK